MKNIRGYIFSRTFMGERVPQHIQNIVIRDQCAKKGLNFLLSATEYAMEGCHLILEEVMLELSYIDGIIFYSLFQLPEENKHRRSIYQRALSLNKTIYFAVEDLALSKSLDIDRIELLNPNVRKDNLGQLFQLY